MPQLIAAPTLIPVPGNKIVEEFIGRVNSGDAQASIARMRSPAGWSEPGQRPEFDEFTVVLQGVMRVEHEGGVTDVAAGQAIVARQKTKDGFATTVYARRRRIRRDMRARDSRRKRYTATNSIASVPGAVRRLTPLCRRHYDD